MKRNNQVAVLAGLTVFGLGMLSPAAAETMTVTRGPNGAAHQVKVDRIPQDAQVQPNTPATSTPAVVTKGSNGAAHITQSNSARQSTAQSLGNANVVTRGPNGAAHIR